MLIATDQLEQRALSRVSQLREEARTARNLTLAQRRPPLNPQVILRALARRPASSQPSSSRYRQIFRRLL
jgi:hypothetical protein